MYPVIFELPTWFPFLGGAPITSFGVFMLLSFLTGGYVIRAELRRIGEDPEKSWDLVFMGVVGGIVGAKGYYLLLNYPSLIADPVGMILSRGGLVWYGGFLLATVLVIREIKRQKLGVPRMADIIAPALALGYSVGRVGCFLVGDDWGRPTDSMFGVRFPRGTPATTVQNIEQMFGITVDPELIEQYGQVVPVHPTQLYEVGLSTLIFFVLWRMRDHSHAKGWLFMVWLSLAGLERFMVEFLRAKDDRFFGLLTLAQVISLAIVAVGLVGLMKLRSKGGLESERA
ncbi:MAG: prolipoprotein diacylglyceryl transferase [Gemmatimonadetes bacterium]|nr:prolipoprotein diacylglyceryl transferase [Gemmatimonadota bacterium]MDA1103087.1 prolipoprotein diacylglyceryl transferase [Gemmatimonadota bacterium]